MIVIRQGVVFAIVAMGFVLNLSTYEAMTKDYYVARQSENASDSNSGTEQKPWKTINRSLEELEPGDTVYVKEGTYREQVVLSTKAGSYAGVKCSAFPSGKSYNKMISFIAYPGDKVTIKGSDVVKGWQKYEDEIWIKKSWKYNSQQVFCDGEILQQVAGKMGEKQLNRFWRRGGGRIGEGLEDMKPGSFYYDLEGKNLYVWLKDDGNPNKHLIEASVRPFLFKVFWNDYIRVSGFRMRHSNVSAYVNWPPVGLHGSHSVAENLDVQWTDFAGIAVGGSNNTLVDSTFSHCGNKGLSAGGWGNRIINCETSYNNYRRFLPGWSAGGVKICNARDLVLSGHIAAHNINSDGIWFDVANSNVVVRNCISHHNGKHGFHYEIGERGMFKNNISYENKMRGIYLINSAYTAVLHNLCYKNGMSGIVVMGSGSVHKSWGRGKSNIWPAAYNLVWGNILIDNCHPDLCPKDKDTDWSKRPELIFPIPSSVHTDNKSNYNIFYRSDGRNIPFWEGWGKISYKNLSEWQQATDNDKDSIVARPLFENLKERNFRPVKGSPAINFVLPSMSMRYDFDDEKRILPASRKERKYHTAGPFKYSGQ